MNLSGKVAIVTGAGTGIGQGVALELGLRGAKVAVHYNRSRAGAEETLRRMEAAGGEGFLVQADVARKEEIDRMTEAVADRYGALDILVCNAALQLNCPFFDYDEEKFDRMMATNLMGYWLCMQAAIPHMKRKRWGRMILISSVHGKRPGEFDAVYSMTKGGIRMLARESAIELARYGITVNMIEPGAVDVGKIPQPSYTPEETEQLRRSDPRNPFLMKFPLGRVGKPVDIAKMACFLASEDSAYMTGSAIRMDGGSMLL